MHVARACWGVCACICVRAHAFSLICEPRRPISPGSRWPPSGVRRVTSYNSMQRAAYRTQHCGRKHAAGALELRHRVECAECGPRGGARLSRAPRACSGHRTPPALRDYAQMRDLRCACGDSRLCFCKGARAECGCTHAAQAWLLSPAGFGRLDHSDTYRRVWATVPRGLPCRVGYRYINCGHRYHFGYEKGVGVWDRVG